jgi:hypothetical protein
VRKLRHDSIGASIDVAILVWFQGSKGRDGFKKLRAKEMNN